MTKKQRATEIKQSEDIDEAKTRLLWALSKLEDGGPAQEIMRLGSIIGRLEAWQNSR